MYAFILFPMQALTSWTGIEVRQTTRYAYPLCKMHKVYRCVDIALEGPTYDRAFVIVDILAPMYN